jgi:hypothetical protein
LFWDSTDPGQYQETEVAAEDPSIPARTIAGGVADAKLSPPSGVRLYISGVGSFRSVGEYPSS